MQRFLGSFVLAALAALPAARPAAAQVYPERILKDKALRIVDAAYQRRSRDDNREEQTERITKTLRLGGNGFLDLGNIAGDVTVTRGGGSDATVEIVKTARGHDVADAREMLQLVQVDVSERAGRAEVKTRYPGDQRQYGRRNVNVSVAYNVTAPAGTRLSVQSISGSIKVTDIKGEVSATSVSGDVRISGASHVMAAKSISGMVDIVETQTDSGLDATSVSGDVVLRRVTARRIDAGTVSGNVKLEEVHCDRVGAHSTSGNLFFSGALARNGRYELKGFSGEVRVVVPSSSGFEVEASTFSGEIRTDLPITTRGRTGRRSLTGTYGDGSAVLVLSTFSGSIVISKK